MGSINRFILDFDCEQLEVSPLQATSESTDTFTLSHFGIMIQTHNIKSCMKQPIFTPSNKNVSPKSPTPKKPPSSPFTVTSTGSMLEHGKTAIRISMTTSTSV